MSCIYHVIRFAQNTTQTLIGDELKTAPALINILADRCGSVNKLTACLTLGKFVVKHFVADFVLVRMDLKTCSESHSCPVLQLFLKSSRKSESLLSGCAVSSQRRHFQSSLLRIKPKICLNKCVFFKLCIFIVLVFNM